MADKTIQPGTQISKSVWEEFRNDIKDRKGVVRGHLKQELENAIESYIDASDGGDNNDRLRRIENQIEEIQTHLLGGEGESRKKKKDSSFSSRTRNRLQAIEDQIKREAGDAVKVHESVINQAIEDNAGSSRPTLERYRQMLKQRHIVFENPNQEYNTWITDEETFVQLCQYNWPEKHGMIASEYGEDWFDEKLDAYIDSDIERGFE